MIKSVQNTLSTVLEYDNFDIGIRMVLNVQKVLLIIALTLYELRI